MGQKKINKRKQQVAKLKQKKQAAAHKAVRDEKLLYLLGEAEWFRSKGEHEKALRLTNRALKIAPYDKEAIFSLARIAHETHDQQLKEKALTKLYQSEQMKDEIRAPYCHLLIHLKLFTEAVPVIEDTLSRLPRMKIRAPKRTEKELKELLLNAQNYLKFQELVKKEDNHAAQISQNTPKSEAAVPVAITPIREPPSPIDATEPMPAAATPQLIKTTLELDESAFDRLLSKPQCDPYPLFDLVLNAYKLRFLDTFEQLICLPYLTNVRSLWYQEETARKILKSFRGRALLADEVGLGKTVEAGMVLSEYIRRRMVKTALILTPTPLVSQWRDELFSKFDLSFVCTDDDEFRRNKENFWQAPFILSSINIAKSKKNFDQVVTREYDMVIVDEAHHLKNRTTLNWKLVNQIKKRFLLLLSATPVENNLMELYNLVTLLKPGQLGTATDFKKEFMTRGDPTDPQNRTKLRELLGQVMIRNTRDVAKIDIPPRFAETVRIEPTNSENVLYNKLVELASKLGERFGSTYQRLFKTLLEEAGSSPAAIKRTVDRLAPDHVLYTDYWNDLSQIKTLCTTILDTRKNRLLLKIIQQNSGKKLVFLKYRASVDHLAEFLDWHRIGYALFHGGLSNAQKDDAVKQFQENNHIQLLIATEIGGEGRNMQFCSQMINYDLPWNPMKIEQRIGRIHRLGQKKEVRIYNLCAMHSIEDYILEILDKKINMFEMVIGEIDMILGRACKEADFGEMAYDLYISAKSEEERETAFSKLGTNLKRAKTSYEKTKTLDGKLFGDDYEL